MIVYIIESNTLTEEDLPELNRLIADLGERRGQECPWRVFEEINDNARVYAAREERGGRLVGIGILNVDYKAPPPHFGNLQTVAVLPEHRGDGVFSRILDAVEEKARELELEVVAIQCKKSRHRVAFKAYKKRGYRELFPFSGILIGKPHKLGRGDPERGS